jgi:hypothetical protein
MGLTTLDEAFAATKKLIQAVRPLLTVKHVVLPRQAVGTYQAPWGSRTDILAQQGIDVLSWPGQPVRTHFEARPVRAPLPGSTVVGSFSVKAGEQVLQVPLVSAGPLAKPTTRYRLTRTDFRG